MRRNLYFFEAVLFDAVPARARRDRARRSASRLVQPVLELRLVDRRRHGRPSRGRRRHRSRSALELHRRAALRMLRDARRRSWRRRSRTPSLRRAGVRRSSTTSLAQDAEELPSARRAAAPAPRVGAAADQARVHLPPADQHARRPRRREPGLRGRAGAARATSSWCSRTWARATSRTASIRRLLWQVDVFGFHLAGIDIRQGAGVIARRSARCCPGFARRRRGRAAGAADRGAGAPARRGHRARSRRRGGRAAARAGHRRAVAPRPTARRPSRRS